MAICLVISAHREPFCVGFIADMWKHRLIDYGSINTSPIGGGGQIVMKHVHIKSSSFTASLDASWDRLSDAISVACPGFKV